MRPYNIWDPSAGWGVTMGRGSGRVETMIGAFVAEADRVSSCTIMDHCTILVQLQVGGITEA